MQGRLHRSRQSLQETKPCGDEEKAFAILSNGSPSWGEEIVLLYQVDHVSSTDAKLKRWALKLQEFNFTVQ
jgi:hypothetical protein